jgi:hypothetical protein
MNRRVPSLILLRPLHSRLAAATKPPACFAPWRRWQAGLALLLPLIGLTTVFAGHVFARGALPLSEPGRGATVAAPACTPGNVVAYGRSLVVPQSDWICGDADVYGGSARVYGHVSGNVVALGGSVTVGGEVDGDVTALGGGVTLLGTARVAGDVQAWGGHVTHLPGATVAGNIESDKRIRDFAGGLLPGPATSWHFPAFWLLGWAALAALVATLLPERTARVRQVARAAAGRSLLVGMLTALLGVGLAALLFATCIGIPFSFLLLLSLLAAWVLGTVAISLWLGERLLSLVALPRPSPVLAAVIGAAVLAIGESVPCLGAALTAVASCVGLGAALLSRFGGRYPAPSAGRGTPPMLQRGG